MYHRIVSLVALSAILLAALVAPALAQDGDDPEPNIPGVGLVAGPAAGEAEVLLAGGATFPQPLYERWFAVYFDLTGVVISYEGIGSGGGQRGILAGGFDFAGSDAYLSDAQLAETGDNPLLHIPMTLGGVAIIYHLPGVDETLQLTPETLSLVFSGADAPDPLLRWNDPRLVADNPFLAKVDEPVQAVHRSDSSGTSFIFTGYLAAVSAWWADTIGAGKLVAWPQGGLGGRGNDGVAGLVANTPYALGYVERGYAVQHDLPVAALQNRAGNFVRPTPASISAAAAGVPLPDDMRVDLVNADGENAYPIVGFTWALVYEQQDDPAIGLALARYLWWATHDGQVWTATTDEPVVAGYAPLPLPAIARAEALLRRMTIDGEPALPPAILAWLDEQEADD